VCRIGIWVFCDAFEGSLRENVSKSGYAEGVLAPKNPEKRGFSREKWVKTKSHGLSGARAPIYINDVKPRLFLRYQAPRGGGGGTPPGGSPDPPRGGSRDPKNDPPGGSFWGLKLRP
jgi:hypothetical protein